MSEATFEFRKLKADDVFPMFQLLSKIGLKDIKESLDPAVVAKIAKAFSADKKADQKEQTNLEDIVYSVGFSITLDIANILIGNLANCKNEIYTLLSNVSGMKKSEIADLDFVTFTEMIIAFVKKEEFKDFIGVVSKLFN